MHQSENEELGIRGAYALFKAWYAHGVDRSRCPRADGAVKGNEALSSVGFRDRMAKHLDGIWTAPLAFILHCAHTVHSWHSNPNIRLY